MSGRPDGWVRAGGRGRRPGGRWARPARTAAPPGRTASGRSSAPTSSRAEAEQLLGQRRRAPAGGRRTPAPRPSRAPRPPARRWRRRSRRRAPRSAMVTSGGCRAPAQAPTSWQARLRRVRDRVELRVAVVGVRARGLDQVEVPERDRLVQRAQRVVHVPQQAAQVPGRARRRVRHGRRRHQHQAAEGVAHGALEQGDVPAERRRTVPDVHRPAVARTVGRRRAG